MRGDKIRQLNNLRNAALWNGPIAARPLGAFVGLNAEQIRKPVRSEAGALKPLAKFLRRHGPRFTTRRGCQAIRDRGQEDRQIVCGDDRSHASSSDSLIATPGPLTRLQAGLRGGSVIGVPRGTLSPLLAAGGDARARQGPVDSASLGTAASSGSPTARLPMAQQKAARAPVSNTALFD